MLFSEELKNIVCISESEPMDEGWRTFLIILGFALKFAAIYLFVAVLFHRIVSRQRKIREDMMRQRDSMMKHSFRHPKKKRKLLNSILDYELCTWSARNIPWFYVCE